MIRNTEGAGILNDPTYTIENYGTITVSNTGGVGISNEAVDDTAGTVVNSGTISVCGGSVSGVVPTSGNPTVGCIFSGGSYTVVVTVLDPERAVIHGATAVLNGDSQQAGLAGVASFSQCQWFLLPEGFGPRIWGLHRAIDVYSYTTEVTVVLEPIEHASGYTSDGASETQTGGFSGVSASFTNNMASSEIVNVGFVRYNQANRVVNIGVQQGVVFAPGETLTFTCTYSMPGTYTVKVFIIDFNFKALSPTYSATVTV